MISQLTPWTKLFDWLFNQRKEIVINFIWVGIFIVFVVYIQPTHLKIINDGYAEVQRRNHEAMDIRDQRFIERLQQIEQQLTRFNSNIEKRDEAQSRLIEELVRRRESK